VARRWPEAEQGVARHEKRLVHRRAAENRPVGVGAPSRSSISPEVLSITAAHNQASALAPAGLRRMNIAANDEQTPAAIDHRRREVSPALSSGRNGTGRCQFPLAGAPCRHLRLRPRVPPCNNSLLPHDRCPLPHGGCRHA
jgi:hypothetical protein